MNKLLLLSGIVLLAACSDNNPQPTTEAVATPEPTAVAPAIPAPAQVKTCNVETVDKQTFKAEVPVVDAGARVRFTGWAIDATTHGVPVKPMLRLAPADGDVVREVPIEMWRDRPDVVAANGGEHAFLKSGFSVDVDTKGLAPGLYAASIGYPGDPVVVCDVGRRVEIR